MPIGVGERVPEVELKQVTAAGARAVRTDAFFAGRTVVLFGVPGAFTSTCSDVHLPGFLVRADEILGVGVDAIACTAVNDAAVMAAWGRTVDPTGVLTLLADGNGELATAVGLDFDARRFGLGRRSRRYAAIIEDGVVAYLGVEEGPEVGVSSADAVIAALTSC